MQAVPPLSPSPQSNFSRKLGYLFIAPLTVFVLGVLVFAMVVVGYQSRHNDKIFTGVAVGEIDLSQLSKAEAEDVLKTSSRNAGGLHLVDSYTGQSWTYTYEELGLRVDLETTVDLAYEVGRRGGSFTQFQELFQVWYYGRSLSPTYIFDEGQLSAVLNQLSSEINQPAINARMLVDGDNIQYQQGQKGRALDVAHLESQIRTPLLQFQAAEIELLVHDIRPSLSDVQAIEYEVDRMFTSAISFYLQEPLDEFDLDSISLAPEDLVRWLRVEVVAGQDGGYQHHIFIDEVALTQWLSQFADDIYREPVNARFYFDDNTRELVLVAPHINGRELDIPATIAPVSGADKNA